jgi:hypothetical protein
MNRRTFLRQLGPLAATASAVTRGFADQRSPGSDPAVPAPFLTSPEEIQSRVKAAQPSLGGTIPADFAERLGTTHYDGQYSFSQEPFLIEGCKAIRSFGMKAAKLWLGAPLPGYGFHSDWHWAPRMRLADVARHPYFREVFAMPFSTFALEIQPVTAGTRFNPDADFSGDEQQFYELAAHLLETYRGREVTFILQHWEGDWMLRGSYGEWKPGGPPNIDERCDAFARWLAARQSGVTRARAAAGLTRCRVYHAAEVNKVLDSLQGIPTLTTRVLPHVALDFISWSSYDGMNSPVSAWHGLDLIHHYAKPAPGEKEPRIMIGEIGLPEQGRKEADVVAWWDVAMGVLLARRVPHIFHWELYCNEPIDGKKDGVPARKAEELRGFWLIRPDGSPGYAAKYLKRLLEHAGKTLP